MLDKEFIIQSLQERTSLLRQKFHIEKMGLFGSFSRGQQTDESDIDFIIELDPLTADIFETKTQLRRYLQDLFHRKIELAHYRYLKPYARDIILKEVQPIV